MDDFSPIPYIATVLNSIFWVFYGMPFVHPGSRSLIFDWKLCLIFVYYKHVTSDWSWHSYMILHLQSNCNSTWIAPTKSIGDPKEYIGQTCSWVQIYFSFCPSSLEIVHLYSLVQHLQCVHVEMYWDLYSKCLKLVLSCI